MRVEFDSNQLAATVYGTQDTHLTQIEQALGVILRNRGNQLDIQGNEPAKEIAHHLLMRLYQHAEAGEDITTDLIKDYLAERHLSAPTPPILSTPKLKISPRTENQLRYVTALQTMEMVFGVGPAGCGKTWLAAAAAIEALLTHKVKRIILTRPAVEAGERLGFLPGALKEKVDPYLRPIYDALGDMVNEEMLAHKLEAAEIEIAPLAYMRGRNLKDAFIIVDEAQNTTPMQMKMVLTRIGTGSQMVINGDLTQTDLPHGQLSGLKDALNRLEGMEEIAICSFDGQDVMRHALISKIIARYDDSNTHR